MFVRIVCFAMLAVLSAGVDPVIATEPDQAESNGSEQGDSEQPVQNGESRDDANEEDTRKAAETLRYVHESLDEVKRMIEGAGKPEAAPPRESFSPDDAEIGRFLKAEESDGAETPRALLKRLIDGFRENDAKKVAGCFDRTKEDGRIAAAGFGVLCGLYESAMRLEEKARKKFGEEGAEAVRADMADSREDTSPEAHAVRAVDSERWLFFGDESVGWVVVRLPVRQVQKPSLFNAEKTWPASRKVELRNGRWYLVEPTLWEVTDYGRPLIESQIKLWIKRAELYDDSRAVEECETLEEFREWLGVGGTEGTADDPAPSGDEADLPSGE